MTLNEFFEAVGRFFLKLGDQEMLTPDEAQENAAAEFMLAEYQDFYQNVMHLENKLFNHLSFFTTLFMGIFTASIAILQLVNDENSSFGLDGVLALLSSLFVLFIVIGRFELRMTMELRVRKIKFVEGITQIRKCFADRDASILRYLALPVGLKKAPPYLRVGSKDWYQMLYMASVSGLAALVAWMCLWQPVRSQLSQWNASAMVSKAFNCIWIPVGIELGLLVLRWFYRTAMEYCRDYDREREKIGGQSEYDLFERSLPESRWAWGLGDWMRWSEDKNYGQRRS